MDQTIEVRKKTSNGEYISSFRHPYFVHSKSFRFKHCSFSFYITRKVLLSYIASNSKFSFNIISKVFFCFNKLKFSHKPYVVYYSFQYASESKRQYSLVFITVDLHFSLLKDEHLEIEEKKHFHNFDLFILRYHRK